MSARVQSETISILITSFLWLLDLLRFALIQRGNVFFWMHLCPKKEEHFVATYGSKIISAGAHKSRRSALLCASVIMSVSTQAERLQGSLVDSRSNCRSIIRLERRQRPACLSSQAPT